MAFTSLTLINEAWYWSGLVGPDFESVSGNKTTQGLYLLNFILTSLSQDDARQIPYYDHFTIPAIAGQEKYFIPNLVDLEVLTFNLADGSSPVRFELERYSRYRYLAINRVENIQTLPYCYYTERVNGGMDVYLYFVPNTDYPLNFTGKLSIDPTNTSADLTLILEQAFLDYLTIYLARYMRIYYKRDPLPSLEMEFKKMNKRMTDVNAPDMEQHHVQLLTKGNQGGDIYAMANFYKGYLPLR